jgi:hypothetical protein
MAMWKCQGNEESTVYTFSKSKCGVKEGSWEYALVTMCIVHAILCVLVTKPLGLPCYLFNCILSFTLEFSMSEMKFSIPCPPAHHLFLLSHQQLVSSFPCLLLQFSTVRSS